MFYFFLELLNFIYLKKIHLFLLFALYTWIVWGAKYYYSRKYKPYNNSYDASVSVVVPVLNEDLNVFDKCLNSIKIQNKAVELIVVIDGSSEDIKKIAHKYADKVLAYEWRGKRPCISDGYKQSNGDIIVMMDSDSIFNHETGISELIKPFQDISVGGVTTTQKIFNREGSIIRRIAGWMEDVRFTVGHPAQSVFGQVGCLPGRAIAIRKKYILPHMENFLNDYFMGEKCITGDDRALTSYLLKDGYKTVLQSSSLVYTDCPNNWLKFIKQQLRWSRSSQRETIRNIGWMVKNNKFLAFYFMTDILTPIFFLIVTIDLINSYFWGVNHFFGLSLYSGILIGSVGMLSSIGVRQSFTINYGIKDLYYLPIYCLFLTFIQTPIRLYGLITCYNQGWMTRKKVKL